MLALYCALLCSGNAQLIDRICSSSVVCKLAFPFVIGVVKLLSSSKPIGSTQSSAEEAVSDHLFNPLAVPAVDFTQDLLPYASVLLQAVSEYSELLQVPCTCSTRLLALAAG